MPTTLTPEQIATIALGMTRNYEFLDLYRAYRNQFPTSLYYAPARDAVITFLYDHIISPYPTATKDDAEAILNLYDRTYGQDFLYDLFPDQIHAFDPEAVLKLFFRAVADFREYFVVLTKGLPALHNPFECPEEYLGWLGGMVGIDVPYDYPVTLKRLKIARAIPWYKIKGTHDSFRIVLRSIGFDAVVEELWSDYQGTHFSTTPDIYPVLPNGSPNPAYDPNNLTDGLIKYKTSYFDVILGMLVDTLPDDIIHDILAAIEEVRPITRTLRNIQIGKYLEDYFDVPTDELEGYMEMDLKDKYPFSFTAGTCIDYSCGSPEFAYYDGMSGYFYDGAIDYSNDIPLCTEFYDHAKEAFYDGLEIADYSGLLDSQGNPFLYSGVYDVTMTYGECSEKDELDIDITMSDVEDVFWGFQGSITYDQDEIFYDGEQNLYYDNLIHNAIDELTIGISFGDITEDPILIDDDLGVDIIPIDDFDYFNPTVHYDGEYTYGMTCHTYGDADYYCYNGTFLYDGSILYNGSASDFIYDGSTGWNYDCNATLHYNNIDYDDVLEIDFSGPGSEDIFPTIDDEFSGEGDADFEETVTVSDEVEQVITVEDEDLYELPYLYGDTGVFYGSSSADLWDTLGKKWDDGSSKWDSGEATIEFTYAGFSLHLHDELEIVQVPV
jgi:phage tail P2-like protein